ncbi:hypothetical protein [Sporosarcina jiandibaonis]|uniref:hypothetical protein n=1 Tax=Sporosarcina jiandibaonis TaxID=2715535 RepID=UPI001553C097|nr:hypothetical protein [Sporosarcina jiandibaonis]
MTEKVITSPLTINQSHLSFILPLGYDTKRKSEFARALESNGFSFFQLENNTVDDNIYGDNIRVDHEELEQYFLPYVEHNLFPTSLEDKGFHRFTTSVMKSFNFNIRNNTTPFTIRSLDIILSPFGIVLFTMRVDLNQKKLDLSDVLDFMHHFRTIESKLEEERGAEVVCPATGKSMSMHGLLFEELCPFLEKFILHDEKLSGYFGSLPYYKDERMYASAFLFCEEGSAVTNEQLYRMGSVDGKLPNESIFISANNPDYIKRNLKQTLHDRWAPHEYTVVTDHAFITVTNKPPKSMERELSQYMGTHYYNLLLHYFYKIILLRVSFEYSKINWDKDEEYVKLLIKLITLFSSLYYYQEVSTRSEGNELSQLIRRSFNIETLFKEVNNTLNELYKSQENNASDRMNMLLFILTVFTVVSGIYGMNLVIKDWESPTGWKAFSSYTIFEWVSLITAVSGIVLSGFLIFSTVRKFVVNKIRRMKSDNHFE